MAYRRDWSRIKHSAGFKAAPAVYMERNGDWAIARSIFRGLAFRLDTATQLGGKAEAEMLAAQVRQHILAGTFEGIWPALSEDYAARKQKEVGEQPVLVHGKRKKDDDTKRYVDSIEGFQLGRNRWAVGVKGDESSPNVQKGLTHEWGSREGKKPAVPARPHFRPTLELYRTSGAGGRILAAMLSGAIQGMQPKGLKVDLGEDEGGEE